MICSDCEKEKKHHAKELCRKCYTKQWRKDNPEKVIKSRKQIPKDKRIEYAANRRKVLGRTPYYENKDCSQYLGIHIAERILSKVFTDVERMPFNNSGYDFICNKGKKIDVKSSCLSKIDEKFVEIHNPRWSFTIRKNKAADFFLCIAFDNREDLNPRHVWLIPGEKVNMKTKISATLYTVYKFDNYKINAADVVSCCDEIKQ